MYLLNEEGIFQTMPRFGANIMDKASFEVGPYHADTRVRQVTSAASGHGEPRRQEQSSREVLLQNPRWMLVIRQDYDEAFSDVEKADSATLLFLLTCAGAVCVAAVVFSRSLVRSIRKGDEEADRMNGQIEQAGRLSAIGELSAAVAHEIDRPLGSILAQRRLVLGALERNGYGRPRIQVCARRIPAADRCSGAAVRGNHP